MKNLILQLFHDEVGFIVSAELVLVSTIVVLGLVVGLSEVSSAVNQELEDVGSAFGSINQSYRYAGLSGCQGEFAGSGFGDARDYCDSQFDIACDTSIPGEARNGYYDNN